MVDLLTVTGTDPGTRSTDQGRCSSGLDGRQAGVKRSALGQRLNFSDLYSMGGDRF